MYLILLRYEVDDLLWAGTYASAASHTVDSVYYCYSVDYIDSVKLTCVMAISESDTSEHAGIRRSEPSLSALAGLHALPVEYSARSIASAVAHNLSYLRLSLADGSSENLCDLLRYGCSTRRAKRA